MKVIWLSIKTQGAWPNQTELNTRNTIEEVLTNSGIGTFQGAGGGSGTMDLSYKEVVDEQVARTTIEAVMKLHMPIGDFNIHVEEE